MAFLTKVKVIEAKTYSALETKLNDAIYTLDVIDIKFPESMIYTAVVHFKSYHNTKCKRLARAKRLNQVERIEAAE